AWIVPWATIEFAPFQDWLKTKVDASLVHFVQTTAYYFRPLSLLTAFAALFLAFDRLGRARGLLLTCLLLVPFLLLAVIGGSIAKTTARYAICALPVVTWLSAFACTTLAGLLAARAGPGRLALRLCGLVLPLAIAADFAVQTWAYFHIEHGGRAQWREACAAAVQRAGGAGLRVLTINEPTALYYLRPGHWADWGQSADRRVQIHLLSWWGVLGTDRNKVVLHEPGGRAHLGWHQAAAQREAALLVVFVTLPELREMDVDGSLWRTLREDFELVLHLPCWVGPKDESIYMFVPSKP
ncbi:MAG: hypothetical protein Q7T30_03035, partial [Planctomycetota bacterium]|nr:hypothetical protein [Planctomycetota bacterium]